MNAGGPRRFAIVTETYPPEINGVALTLARLAGGLHARGHRVSIARPRQRADVLDGATRDGLTTTLVRGLALPGYPGVQFGLPARRVLRAAWAASRPDAVYIATEGPLGWSALGAARALGVPALSGFHTNFHQYMGHYGAGWLRRPAVAWLRRFHNATAGTVVPSGELRDQLHAAGFANLHVLGRGVDTRLFAPERRSAVLRASWGAGPTDLVVAHVGRLAAEKNIDLAVAAFRAMARVDGSARFVIVGDGPRAGSLRREHPDFVFGGLRLGVDLAAHYASADVFLFPSVTETFGNVTLEALASGLAVVAYDYAAAHRHIVSGESGVLAPCGDAGAFIAGAVQLARAPALRETIRRGAREAALPVDWTRVVERFEGLLASVAARSSDEEPEVVAPSPHPVWTVRSMTQRGGVRW